VQHAGERARAWMAGQASSSVRVLALDEQFSSQRGHAYLNVVDVHSGQVWASLPPAAVEGESWMIVLWDLQAQGVRYQTTVSDGGHAIHEALKHLNQLGDHQRDVWHVLTQGAKVQARLEALICQQEERLRIISRYEQRQAQAERITGRPPKTTAQEQRAMLKQLMHVWEALAYLLSELQRLLQVVVLQSDAGAGLLPLGGRQQELQTLIHLLAELATHAPASLQADIGGLARLLDLALPSLLRFAEQLQATESNAIHTLGVQAVHLIGWAWQRRGILGPDLGTLLQGFAPAWRPVAQLLMQSWDQAVRASSVVENWHSILRPHLAVHRTLSAGMLALLALWHNHRIAPRGPHEGLSPLQRSQAQADPLRHDWLTALGYLPGAA
jgi:hypothetical protein